MPDWLKTRKKWDHVFPPTVVAWQGYQNTSPRGGGATCPSLNSPSVMAAGRRKRKTTVTRPLPGGGRGRSGRERVPTLNIDAAWGGGAQLWQRRRRQTACSGFLKTVSGASASEGRSQREPVKTVKVRRVSVLACGVSRLTCQRQRVTRCPLGDVAQETHDSHAPPELPAPSRGSQSRPGSHTQPEEDGRKSRDLTGQR